MNNNKKILISFPTRQRPDRFKISLDSLIENIVCLKDCKILVKLDDNDRWLMTYTQMSADYAKYPVEWTIGESKNKVHAQNRDIERYIDNFDIIVSWSDDMLATYKGMDGVIRGVFDKHFPDTDGCPLFIDYYREKMGIEQIPVMACIGRAYWKRFGYLLYPGYESLYADDEMLATSKILNKHVLIKKPYIYSHEHPNNNKDIVRDEQYTEQDSKKYYDKDGALFQERLKNNFGL